MKYENFLEILMYYRKIEGSFRELYQMGFNFLDGKYPLSEEMSKMLDATLKSHFTDEGVDWIHWFIYENEWGEKDWSQIPRFDPESKNIIEKDLLDSYGAKDENGNPICFSFKSTWDYVKKYLKK